jgi:hypothetical protein
MKECREEKTERWEERDGGERRRESKKRARDFRWFLTIVSSLSLCSGLFSPIATGVLASRTLDRGPRDSLRFFFSSSSHNTLSPHAHIQMSFYTPPNQQRSLRACMVCSVVQLHNVRKLPVPRYLPTPGSQVSYTEAEANHPILPPRNSCATAVPTAKMSSSSVGTTMPSKNALHKSLKV